MVLKTRIDCLEQFCRVNGLRLGEYLNKEVVLLSKIGYERGKILKEREVLSYCKFFWIGGEVCFNLTREIKDQKVRRLKINNATAPNIFKIIGYITKCDTYANIDKYI